MAALRHHVDDPVLFRQAVAFTAAETGLAPRLVEKDYFCSVLLEHLGALDETLVFRGGTCLAKVHAGFYRLSEDLDFLPPIPKRSSSCGGSSRCRGTPTAASGAEASAS